MCRIGRILLRQKISLGSSKEVQTCLRRPKYVCIFSLNICWGSPFLLAVNVLVVIVAFPLFGPHPPLGKRPLYFKYFVWMQFLLTIPEHSFKTSSFVSCWSKLRCDGISLTKRSLKGFLLNILKAGRCAPPRLVPPHPARGFPRQNTPNWKFLQSSQNFSKFLQSSFRFRFVYFL